MHVRVCISYTGICNNLIYVHISIRVPYPSQDIMNFIVFEGPFLNWAPQAVLFYATATHSATMLQKSRMPHFLLWNECYKFVLKSKFHSARKDQEMDEQVELSWRKYSRRRIGSYNLASLAPKFSLVDSLAIAIRPCMQADWIHSLSSPPAWIFRFSQKFQISDCTRESSMQSVPYSYPLLNNFDFTSHLTYQTSSRCIATKDSVIDTVKTSIDCIDVILYQWCS